MSEKRACEEILSRRVSFISCAMFCRCLSLSLCLPLCVSVFMRCVTLRVLIANRMVTDSSCRGGIAHIRCGCSRVLSKRSKKQKKFFRHISLLARREHDTKARSHALTRAMRKKKGRRFAAGTRTLVDRGHYFHLKAGHDNHLHHSEPIRKWYDASFLACVTLLSRY